MTAVSHLERSRMSFWIKANEESLVKQSRSFSIPILRLDRRFMVPVMVQYNVNKAIDTIEDSTALEVDEKIELIGTFCEYFRRDAYSPEVKKRMLQVTPQEESYVFKNYECTINLYNTLTNEEKDQAKKWASKMAEGMCHFLKTSIHTPQDLNDYCYYVAGTVGIYLTVLLRLKGSNITEGIFEKLENNAVPFGSFLQKLNIIRDYVEDKATKKRTFWPRSYFEHEKDLLKILNKMTYETLRNDASRAIEYFTHIPPGNDSFDHFIRFILSSGIEYLKVLRNNKRVFSNTKVKLSKLFIKDLYSRVSSLSHQEFRDYCKRSYADEIASYDAMTQIT